MISPTKSLGLVFGIALALAPHFASANDEQVLRRREYRDPVDIAKKLQRIQKVFPVRTVDKSHRFKRLGPFPDRANFDPTYELNGNRYSMADFHRRTLTSAFLVLKDDLIVSELYLEGSSASTRFLGYSLAKSFTSTLVGMAIEDGLIQGVHDPLTKYLPALTGGVYGGVTIQDALQMLSGAEFMEFEGNDYDWRNEAIPASRVYQAAMVDQKYRYNEAANTLRRKFAPRTQFHYSDMDASLLGALIENATGMRLATYMQKKLWEPAGMEHDAYWALDGPPEIGREVAALGFAASLRDYGRFGLLALHRGRLNGRQLVSEKWFAEATSPQHPAVGFGKLYPDYPLAYGYCWWILPNGDFTGQGAFGHFVYVAPRANVVIVKHSHWPKEWVDEMEMETAVFFDAVVAALGETGGGKSNVQADP
ncbi:MAG: serine hydrolase domain-containing protein [Limisphaerales bacterium]